jgi:hypothetical protein
VAAAVTAEPAVAGTEEIDRRGGGATCSSSRSRENARAAEAEATATPSNTAMNNMLRDMLEMKVFASTQKTSDTPKAHFPTL